jgi:hypothetical protein
MMIGGMRERPASRHKTYDDTCPRTVISRREEGYKRSLHTAAAGRVVRDHS